MVAKIVNTCHNKQNTLWAHKWLKTATNHGGTYFAINLKCAT